MKCYMIDQEKGDPFYTGDCLIEVTAWTGVVVLNFRCIIVCPSCACLHRVIDLAINSVIPFHSI